MEITKLEKEDIIGHENHELILTYVDGFGFILRCLDCKMNILNLEVKKNA